MSRARLWSLAADDQHFHAHICYRSRWKNWRNFTIQWITFHFFAVPQLSTLSIRFVRIYEISFDIIIKFLFIFESTIWGKRDFHSPIEFRVAASLQRITTNPVVINNFNAPNNKDVSSLDLLVNCELLNLYVCEACALQLSKLSLIFLYIISQ